MDKTKQNHKQSTDIVIDEQSRNTKTPQKDIDKSQGEVKKQIAKQQQHTACHSCSKSQNTPKTSNNDADKRVTLNNNQSSDVDSKDETSTTKISKGETDVKNDQAEENASSENQESAQNIDEARTSTNNQTIHNKGHHTVESSHDHNDRTEPPEIQVGQEAQAKTEHLHSDVDLESESSETLSDGDSHRHRRKKSKSGESSQEIQQQLHCQNYRDELKRLANELQQEKQKLNVCKSKKEKKCDCDR